MGFRPPGWPMGTVRKTATEAVPSIMLDPDGRRVDRVLYQPMHSALRPDAHRVEHKVVYVGLLSLVHHVVVLVNMKNVRRRDPVGAPLLSPSGESVIVPVDNDGDWAIRPPEKTTELAARIRY